jgi:hypothetical protein
VARHRLPVLPSVVAPRGLVRERRRLARGKRVRHRRGSRPCRAPDHANEGSASGRRTV